MFIPDTPICLVFRKIKTTWWIIFPSRLRWDPVQVKYRKKYRYSIPNKNPKLSHFFFVYYTPTLKYTGRFGFYKRQTENYLLQTVGSESNNREVGLFCRIKDFVKWHWKKSNRSIGNTNRTISKILNLF